MSKRCWLCFLAWALLAASLPAQERGLPTLVPAENQVKITGWANYYGNADYISVSVRLTWKARPLSGVIVRLNEAVITDRGGGEYVGALTPYVVRLGADLAFSLEFPKSVTPLLHRPPFAGRVTLATYRIANIVEWVFPVPKQVINLSAFPALLTLRWNFTGAPATTEIFIKDRETNDKVFSRHLAAESVAIPTKTLRPGKEYVFGVWAFDAIDKFKNTRAAAPGSEVVWYFNDTFLFSTQDAGPLRR